MHAMSHPQIENDKTSLRALYDALPPGRQATVLRKFKTLYGSMRTFYRKINNEVRVKPAEQMFLINLLTNDNTGVQRHEPEVD